MQIQSFGERQAALHDIHAALRDPAITEGLADGASDPQVFRTIRGLVHLSNRTMSPLFDAQHAARLDVGDAVRHLTDGGAERFSPAGVEHAPEAARLIGNLTETIGHLLGR